MKLRLTLAGDADHAPRDVTITADVTATIGELARSLIRAGVGDRQLESIAANRQAPLTLRATPPGRHAIILDSGDPLNSSGLLSGCTIEPVLESDPGRGTRARAAVAALTVLNGSQRGAVFFAVTGENLIGRDRGSRVELHDPGISRRHAVLQSRDGVLQLCDLGSANGTSIIPEQGSSQRLSSSAWTITRSVTVSFGEVRARIDPGPASGETRAAIPSSEFAHSQSPRVDPVFQPPALDLPAPPEDSEPTRFPLVAMFAPLAMGIAMYMLTQSSMSLLFIALSPLMIVGTWFDARVTRRKQTRIQRREFQEGMAQAAAELVLNSKAEQTARNAETPPPEDLLRLGATRGPLLWTRRPEHRAFLELRLGLGLLSSRKEVQLPNRGKIKAEDWAQLSQLHRQHAKVPNVPVLERLDRCGSIAVAGPSLWAGGALRALIVQLLALHSPADLVLTGFASQTQAAAEWGWLKWVPHVDSAFSPLTAPHLAASQDAGNLLLTDLEHLITQRQHSGGSASTGKAVRSRTTHNAADASERLAPAQGSGFSPSIVVVVLSDGTVDRTRLVGIAEDGANVGVHLLWLASELHAVPAACRTAIEVSARESRVHFVREGKTISLTGRDTLSTPQVEAFGRELAPVTDAGARALDESDLPRIVSLAPLLAEEVLGTSGAVAERWRSNRSLTARWQLGAEQEPGQLVATIGQGSAGPVEIDLRTHGPHALVGGTTGSGKSEFLQTWLLSLAATISPDRLTFLLIDYKGGAAFADCVALPHTVGLVTDLNTHLVQRALTSLRAELRYREELLAEKGAKDLIALERRGDPEAPPILMLVIDEFAALVAEIPEFVDGVIDVAQRGRSLGLHLVLATQRPAGVVTDNLRANTNLRIGLRMSDAADSVDVLGTADAAGFAPDTPGRAAIQIGSGRLVHLQTAYVGGRTSAQRQEPLEINDLDFGKHAPWVLHPEALQQASGGSNAPRDIQLLTRNISLAARECKIDQPRKPWVDELPRQCTLAELWDGSLTHGDGEKLRDAERPGEGQLAQRRGSAVGLMDEPHLQRRAAYSVDLAKTGSLAIFGGAGSGKTTALVTIARAAIEQDPSTQVFGIDNAGGRLAVLGQLPSTGDIVPADDIDRTSRLLGMVLQIVTKRIQTIHGPKAPILLLIDGFAAFRDSYEALSGAQTPLLDVSEIARLGRSVGVYIVVASERALTLPAALAANIKERLVLSLPAESDYQLLGVKASALKDAPPGRAIRVESNAELQFAVPCASSHLLAGKGPVRSGSPGHPGFGDEDAASVDDHIDLALQELAKAQRDAGVVEVAGVPRVPEHVTRTEMAFEPGVIPFAIDTVELRPQAAPDRGLMLVTGPAGSGRTTAIRALLAAQQEHAERAGKRLEGLLISPRRSALRGYGFWTEVADSVSERGAKLARIALALGGKSPSPALELTLPTIDGARFEVGDERAEDAVDSGPQSLFAHEAHGVVVVEDIGGFDGTGDEAALASLLKLLRRSEHAVIVEGENATLGAVWELSAPLRGARWGLALQPDANDTPSVFAMPFTRAKRASFPPGRGYLVRGGTITGVQVAAPP